MDISRQQARLVTEEIDAAVKAILAKHGLTAGQAKTNYGYQYKYTITASVPVVSDNGFDIGTPEAQTFILLGPTSGFANPKASLGVPFTVNGKTFIVTGWNSRAPKFPLVGKNLTDGTAVKMPRSWLKHIPGYDAGIDYSLPLRVNA